MIRQYAELKDRKPHLPNPFAQKCVHGQMGEYDPRKGRIYARNCKTCVDETLPIR